jgi:acetylglutamate kinase
MDKLFIIKIGGQIIDDEAKLASFLQSFAGIKEPKILIHGGGKLASALAEKLGVKQVMVEGRRITDAETLKIVTMVYAGLINKNIVAALQAKGCNAIGLCGADGNMITARKRKKGEIDYGFVGDVEKLHTKFIRGLLKKDLVPVLAPLTHDGKGHLLNTNADTIAQEIAGAMSAHYQVTLIYSFEKNGVLMHIDDASSVIKAMNKKEYEKLKKEGKISAGMIPKLDNAFLALKSGVKKVVIGKAEELKKLIAGRSGTTLSNG